MWRCNLAAWRCYISPTIRPGIWLMNPIWIVMQSWYLCRKLCQFSELSVYWRYQQLFQTGSVLNNLWWQNCQFYWVSTVKFFLLHTKQCKVSVVNNIYYYTTGYRPGNRRYLHSTLLEEAEACWLDDHEGQHHEQRWWLQRQVTPVRVWGDLSSWVEAIIRTAPVKIIINIRIVPFLLFSCMHDVHYGILHPQGIF